MALDEFTLKWTKENELSEKCRGCGFFFKCEQHAPTINMYAEDINVQMSDYHTIIYIGKWE